MRIHRVAAQNIKRHKRSRTNRSTRGVHGHFGAVADRARSIPKRPQGGPDDEDLKRDDSVLTAKPQRTPEADSRKRLLKMSTVPNPSVKQTCRNGVGCRICAKWMGQEHGNN